MFSILKRHNSIEVQKKGFTLAAIAKIDLKQAIDDWPCDKIYAPQGNCHIDIQESGALKMAGSQEH